MFARVLIVAVALLVPAWGFAAQDPKGNTHEGKVKQAVVEDKGGEHKLIMTDKDGKNEHSHFVAKDAKITIDGKGAKFTDLKPGQVIRVTTKKVDDKVLAVEIAVLPAK